MQARYENAYVHTLNILKGLFDPALANGSLPDMSPAERSKALQTLLQVWLYQAPTALPHLIRNLQHAVL